MREGPLRLHALGIALKRDHAVFDALVEPGRILGLAGLDGHGQEAFLTMLAGMLQPASGIIAAEQADGRRTPILRFRQAVAKGIAYLPRDRRRTGIFPTLSIIDNFALPTAGRDTVLGMIGAGRRRARYERFKDRLSIVAPRPDRPITALSGGNQQKVLLARLLALDPNVLLLNDPTRGVDVATRRILYGVFKDLAAEGMALVVLSSEIEELLVLCDQVLVFRDHALAARLDADALRSERVIAAMFGEAA